MDIFDGRGIDIIPDIHADMRRLERTLLRLGYYETDKGWQHPESRIAAFLGDLIDMGHDNAAVISAVRMMEMNGSAIAIMGNHELNALLYHEPGENVDRINDGWMRSHNFVHNVQHETFLKEFPVGARHTQDVLEWFLTLPVFLDLGGIRMVHAYWDDGHIEYLKHRITDGRLERRDLQEIALEDCDSEFANVILDSLKGPEATLPHGYWFKDIKGHVRNKVRLKWWREDVATWRKAALSVPDLEVLPDIPISNMASFQFYGASKKPVFFGHYKRLGTPVLDAPNALCLDYPYQACAYRWNGEAVLHDQSLVIV